MEKIVRIAKIKGKGIKKRCRKEERIYLQAHDKDEFLALEKLRKQYEKILPEYKYSIFETEIEIFDGILDGINLRQSIMPECKPSEYNYLRIERCF